uniref:CARD domain-containing protein n=1 Tax=Plectus sambesii TaxID=2011161 RepID=A0A914WCJ1_9BILA
MCKQRIGRFYPPHAHAYTLQATLHCVRILLASTVRTWIVKMNDEHKNALQASQYDICQELEAEDVLLYLNTKGVVRDDQVEEILTITRKDMRIMRLILIVRGAGPMAFQEFINALQTCSKEHLTEKIMAHLPSSSTQQITSSEMNTTATFNNQNNQGRLVGAPITGGTVNQGDTHDNSQHTNTYITSRNHGAGMNLSGHFIGERPTIIQNYHNYGSSQAPSTSSSILSQPSTEDWQKKLGT